MLSDPLSARLHEPASAADALVRLFASALQVDLTALGEFRLSLARDGYTVTLSVVAGQPSSHEPAQPIPQPIPQQTSEPAHSTDFRCVQAHGTTYHFSPTQAAVVRQLWEAHSNGTPDVSQADLLEGADSEADRLRDLFRRGSANHPAWGALIVPGEAKGAYRLCLETPVRSASATHSSDYRHVRVCGTTYTFSPLQASIVRQLWEAHDAGNPELGMETLLEGAGSESNNARDLFKVRGGVHPAWGTLIVPGSTRGSFRLDLTGDGTPNVAMLSPSEDRSHGYHLADDDPVAAEKARIDALRQKHLG